MTASLSINEPVSQRLRQKLSLTTLIAKRSTGTVTELRVLWWHIVYANGTQEDKFITIPAEDDTFRMQYV